MPVPRQANARLHAVLRQGAKWRTGSEGAGVQPRTLVDDPYHAQGGGVTVALISVARGGDRVHAHVLWHLLALARYFGALQTCSRILSI